MAPSNKPEADADASASSTQTQSDRSNSSRKRKHDEIEVPVEAWTQFTKVLVGEKETPFQVYTHYLRKIPFFRGCLDAQMKETEESCIRLPEESPKTFGHILTWLYSHTLPIDWDRVLAEVQSIDPSSTLPTFVLDAIHEAVLVYITAQKLLVEDLQNYILTCIFPILEYSEPDLHDYSIVIDMLPEKDGMRRLFSQILAQAIFSLGGWHAAKVKEPSLYEFALRKMEQMEFILDSLSNYPEGKQPIEIGSVCDLHTHIDTPKCDPKGKQ